MIIDESRRLSLGSITIQILLKLKLYKYAVASWKVIIVTILDFS